MLRALVVLAGVGWAWAALMETRASVPLAEGVMSDQHIDHNLPNLPLGNPDTMEHDMPGNPLSPDDFREGKEMEHKDWDPTTNADPIELAGLFQGDIIIMTSAEYDDLAMPAGAPLARNAINTLDKRWPNGVIPYVISSSYNKQERATIAMAVSKYHSNTCIRFVPRTVERDYIHIIKGDGCSSSVGRHSGAQAVSLGPGCLYVGIVMHELMHAAGFWHEQSRWDRDNHITINTFNIQAGMEYNFEKYSWERIQSLGVSYDLGSIMHYGPYAFAKERTKPTIIPRQTGQEIGQRRAFSEKDVLKLQLLYNCANTSTTAVVTVSPILPPSPDNCEDNNKYCGTWAKIGECGKNPTWMHVNCKKSCKKCGAECSDNNEHCTFWAQKNECVTNPSYMSLFCKKSCGVCHTSADYNADVCADDNKHCQAWADSGHCRSNPNYMLLFCRKACKQC
ncbi:zinc metalloproteinase nas-15 [Procambarus clarkii]|uniref:zinc metalloproteinase nas-15 n=1 Tax=Procambarus clarkii TaxID=6728 RepID=UPI001E674149|nr:zinc metalloproteinase nas-15-like [Procambarus clarkii]